MNVKQILHYVMNLQHVKIVLEALVVHVKKDTQEMEKYVPLVKKIKIIEQLELGLVLLLVS